MSACGGVCDGAARTRVTRAAPARRSLCGRGRSSAPCRRRLGRSHSVRCSRLWRRPCVIAGARRRGRATHRRHVRLGDIRRDHRAAVEQAPVHRGGCSRRGGDICIAHVSLPYGRLHRGRCGQRGGGIAGGRSCGGGRGGGGPRQQQLQHSAVLGRLFTQLRKHLTRRRTRESAADGTTRCAALRRAGCCTRLGVFCGVRQLR
jgi:hypothetical protein